MTTVWVANTTDQPTSIIMVYHGCQLSFSWDYVGYSEFLNCFQRSSINGSCTSSLFQDLSSRTAEGSSEITPDLEFAALVQGSCTSLLRQVTQRFPQPGSCTSYVVISDATSYSESLSWSITRGETDGGSRTAVSPMKKSC